MHPNKHIHEKSESPEFYLVLFAQDLNEEVENSVYEAGFDDSLLTMRGGKAAIWICDREGELTALVRDALVQAKKGGVAVSHVEIESEVFANSTSPGVAQPSSS
jgi:hypothetical protein